MVKQMVRDPLFLQQKSEPVTEADKQVIVDLVDTLKANQGRYIQTGSRSYSGGEDI